MLYLESELRELAKSSLGIYKSAAVALAEIDEDIPLSQKFDIFLSHSYTDKALIFGLKTDWEMLGYSVYVDWVVDAHLSRDSVSKTTAALLRQRMQNCKSLFFATSSNSSASKWMPWELGFFDARSNARVAICPIANEVADDFKGQEYLGLYPFVQKDPIKDKNKDGLWIHESKTKYVSFDAWVKGKEPQER